MFRALVKFGIIMTMKMKVAGVAVVTATVVHFGFCGDVVLSLTEESFLRVFGKAGRMQPHPIGQIQCSQLERRREPLQLTCMRNMGYNASEWEWNRRVKEN